MRLNVNIEVRPEIAEAVRVGQPVVALESTLIAHGLPWPINLETARAAETAVRAEDAVPAIIAVLRGVPTVGLNGNGWRGLAISCVDAVSSISRHSSCERVSFTGSSGPIVPFLP